MSATKICPQCSTEYPEDQRFCPRDGSTLKSQSGAGDLIGSVIADRYHVTKKLGEGGMGQVYLAEHVRMGRRSAVKVMNPGMVHDADAISRFNREAANASRINHPNVAAIYDFGETADGLIYLAMEFVEGQPLTDLIDRQGALPAARAASIVRQTGEALTVAHELGIVHRDLKPDNIMIARNRDGSDCVKVVDFGIAKASNNEVQKVTRTGYIVGTPEYMSPEQLAGDKLDGRSDVYSLALVAFAALTGKLPFPSETVQESMIMRLTERPRTLAELKPDVAWPAQLQTVMDRGLARDAADRYASAAEFGRDFERAIERMPKTVATEAKTSIIVTPDVPVTRIAPAPTVVGTATGVAAKRRSRLPLVVGGATVAVAAIVVFAMAGRGATTANAPVQSAVPNGGSVDSGAARPSPAGEQSRPVTRNPESTIASSTSPTTTRQAESHPAPPPSSAAAVDEIRRLSVDQFGPAISRATALLPRLTTGADSARVLYYQAFAYAQQDDMAAACRAASRIRGAGPSDVSALIAELRANCQ